MPFNVYWWVGNFIKQNVGKLPFFKKLEEKEGIKIYSKSYIDIIADLVSNEPLDEKDIETYKVRLPVYVNLYLALEESPENQNSSSTTTIRPVEIEKVIKLLNSVFDSLAADNPKYAELASSKYRKRSFLFLSLFFYYYEKQTDEPATTLVDGVVTLEMGPEVEAEGAEEAPLYWDIDPNVDMVGPFGVFVVRVKNFIPMQEIPFLEVVKDYNGVIFDIVFTSILFSLLDMNYFSEAKKQVIDEITKYLGDFYKRYRRENQKNLKEAFEYWQRRLVRYINSLYDETTGDFMTMEDFLWRLRHLVNRLSNVIYVEFLINVREDEAKKKIRITPLIYVGKIEGTHWVYVNLNHYYSNKAVGKRITARIDDLVFFRPLLTEGSGLSADAVSVHVYNPSILVTLTGRTDVSRSYLALIRTHLLKGNRKEEEEEEEKEVVYKTDLELLTLVPLSLSTEILRASDYSVLKKVKRIREDLGFDQKPKSEDDVLESLYTLARAFNPNYRHFYPMSGDNEFELLGWDQYLSLLFSMLTFLSPTRILSRLTLDYDVRIHTLLYGMKGTGKTLLLKNYTEYIAPGRSILIDPTRNDSIPGLLGGSSSIVVGGKRISIYTGGALLKADGSLVGVDEILDIKKDTLSVIRFIMSSNNIPIRSIRTDIAPTLFDSIPFYASVLAATNPLDQTKFNTLFFFHPEMLMYSNAVMSEPVTALLRKISPDITDDFLAKNILTNPQGFVNTTLKSALERGDIPNELKHILSSTVYELVQSDFSRDVSSKVLDRFTFIIPNYTKVSTVNVDGIDVRKGIFYKDMSVIEDPNYGRLYVSLDDLRAFTSYVQSATPFYDPNKDEIDIDGLTKLQEYGGKVSESVRKMIDKYISKMVSASSIETSVNAVLRQIGMREGLAAYKMLHTILKLYDVDKPNRAIMKAVEFLLKKYYRITYLNPFNIVMGRMALDEYVRRTVNEVIMLSETLRNSNEVILTVDDFESIADKILSEVQVYDAKYDVVIPYQDAKRLVVEMARILAADVDDPRIQAKAEQVKILEKILYGEDFAYRLSLDDLTKKILRSVTVETSKEKGAVKVYLKIGDTKFKVLEVLKG